jgi:DNA-binding protein HU-beta
MKKGELIRAVSRRTKQSQENTRATLDAVMEVALEAMRNHGSVMLMGLGKLVTYSRAARPARHMVTGEKVLVPARRVPHLRFSAAMIEAAKGGA